ncbi:hypothetical protein CHO01_29100 [Cellulomonas hominis]|uniref:Uncharacterized protein n=1 Tax=Cellulomonas hominis TaxID=156981 RepID=A0A511FGT3_9CELL|nr:hypothetical protein [Cellulomonas hominis]MBB5474741.1 hypothetical protein [Cellulomonas hominis]NKY05397.1 hypothetical protein [Cellulomonas hominis]GEL47794.1 hypothetical protein CHO01_29100 [Cellulomonas hominis]
MSDLARLRTALAAEGLLRTDGMSQVVEVDLAHLAEVLRAHRLLTDAPGPTPPPAPTAARRPGPLVVAGTNGDTMQWRFDERMYAHVSFDLDGTSEHDLVEGDETSFVLTPAMIALLRASLVHAQAAVRLNLHGSAGHLIVTAAARQGAEVQLQMASGDSLYLALDAMGVARLLVWLCTAVAHPRDRIMPALRGVVADRQLNAARADVLLRAIRRVPPAADIPDDLYTERVIRRAEQIGTHAVGRTGSALVIARPGDTISTVLTRPASTL